APDSRVDHLPRHVALAEARDLDLASQLSIGPIEIPGELLRRNLDLQPDGVLGGLLDGRLHHWSRAYSNSAKRRLTAPGRGRAVRRARTRPSPPQLPNIGRVGRRRTIAARVNSPAPT